MIAVRNHEERGVTNIGWLQSYHTFSFGGYYNAQYTGFRDLLVINEDYVKPSKGFGMHPHSNMEIITYVVKGAIKHEDSLGNISVLHAGEIQRMSAGSGIVHSEYNNSSDEPVHFLQIWIRPEQSEIDPSYEQKSFQNRNDNFVLVASPNSEQQSLKIHQDAKIYLSNLESAQTLNFEVANARHIWVQVVSGEVEIGGYSVQSGDGIAISDQNSIAITADVKSQLLIFDLP